MSVFSKLFGSFTGRGKAMSLYKRGMHKASKRDLQGAIQDYTEVVEMDKAPDDLRAMALMNRALAHSYGNDLVSAQDDLDKVLAMSGASSQVKEAAKAKLHRMKKRADREG